ncbi:MAG: DUF1641 domain-containing protein [Gemmatimonas sp.]|nr:DUF1641 domain-containing protein [Gemmatimonas sp.]
MAFGLADGNTERQEQLLARLSDPQTVESLNKLLDRMDIIVFAVEALDGFLRRADTIADNVSDSVGDIRTLITESGTTGLMEKLPQLARAGAQVADLSATPAFQRLASSGLIDQLGDPKTIETLRALIDKLEMAAFALESVDGFLRRGDEIAEGIADGVNDLRNAGSTLDLAEMRRTMQSLPKLVQAGNELVESGILDSVPKLVNAGNELVTSGILDPVVVGQLAEVGHLFAQAYSTAKETHPKQHGTIGLALKLRDPDVNRAINFALRLAKAFGQNLNK